MSINSAMLAGVSGLVAQSAALAAVSDNIANVDTVGYKLADTNFETLVASQGVKGDYSAGGVNAPTARTLIPACRRPACPTGTRSARRRRQPRVRPDTIEGHALWDGTVRRAGYDPRVSVTETKRSGQVV